MHGEMGKLCLDGALLRHVLRDAEQITRRLALRRRQGALDGAQEARHTIGAQHALLEADRRIGFEGPAILLAEGVCLTGGKQRPVGSADHVLRPHAHNVAAGLVEENVKPVRFHVLDEDADRQVVDDAVEKRARIADLASGGIDLGAVLHDRQDCRSALETHFSAIGQHFEGLAARLEVNPTLRLFHVGTAADGVDHPFPLMLRADIQNRHAPVFVRAVAVKCCRRLVDDKKAQRCRIIDPHRRRMRCKQ